MRRYYIFIALLGIFVVTLVALGFWEYGTPLDKRALELDKKRMFHFSEIQYAVESYYYENGKIPAKLTDLKGKAVEQILQDPETKKPYEYKRISDTNYKLCTVFSTDSEEVAKKLKSQSQSNQFDEYYYDEYYYAEDYEFTKHKKGYDCMEQKLLGNDYYDDLDIETTTDSIINVDGNFKKINVDYTYEPIDYIADVNVTNAYLASSGATINSGVKAKEATLLIEYTITNKDKRAEYYYGMYLGALKIKGKLTESNSNNFKFINPSQTDKVYGIFKVDSNQTVFDLVLEELEQTKTIALDFNNSVELKGNFDQESGFVEDKN